MLRCYIKVRELIPEVAAIVDMSVIELEYLFDRAEILGEVCVFPADLTPDKQKAFDMAAARH